MVLSGTGIHESAQRVSRECYSGDSILVLLSWPIVPPADGRAW